MRVFSQYDNPTVNDQALKQEVFNAILFNLDAFALARLRTCILKVINLSSENLAELERWSTKV